MLRPGRFDAKVYVGLPDEAARLRLLELGLDGRPLAGDVDLELLADLVEGYSGADIKNLCEKAAADVFLRAVRGGEGGAPKIGMDDLEAVVRQTRASVTPDDLERFEAYRVAHGG